MESRVAEVLHPNLVVARRALMEGAELPEGIIRSSLRRSWERTRASGIRPHDKALYGYSATSAEVRRISEQHRDLIDAVMLDVENLWHSIRSPHWVVLLTDPQGLIIHSMGAERLAVRELGPLQCGRRLLESELGTTAPAVVTSELQGVEVNGGEHFLEELRDFSCAAAPIFDERGRVIGVLDVTGVSAPPDPRALKRVHDAIRSIEGRIYERADAEHIVCVHEDPRFLGTPEQGILLLEEDGLLRSASRTAQDIFGLTEAVPSFEMRLEDLLDVPSLSRLHRDIYGSATNTVVPVHTRHGQRLFLTVRGKRRAPREAVQIQRPATPTMDSQWAAAFSSADRVLARGLPVLIQGETGTGKERFARALHDRHRSGKPFVAVNCAALADGIAESELFGHVEGAFTGSRRGGARGRIEQSQGGTLFLDEIGDMPLHLQTRLLRVLQERRLVRVGGDREIPLDILVLSASHRDLEEQVRLGQLREDLYFRLAGLKVRLPALRDRQDREELIDAILREESAPDAPAILPGPLREHVRSYTWPGNIRQLRHALTAAVALTGADGVIRLDMLPEELQSGTGRDRDVSAENEGRGNKVPASDTIDWLSTRRDVISRCVAQYHGNISRAARHLGLSRTTIYKVLRDG